MAVERPFFVQADCASAAPFEFHPATAERQRSRLILSQNVDLKDEVRSIIHDAPSWLPYAAEAYQVSPKIEDYVMVPVISMPSDLPNRNGAGFPFEQLTRWNLDSGMVMYRTWKGKPTFVEHDNKDPLIARGMIFECLMSPIKGTVSQLWKVIKLTAWDRNKDKVLVNGILTGERNAFSMGALCRDYVCSICGAGLQRDGGCDHVNQRSPAAFKTFGNKVAYFNVEDPIGIECSNVAKPAYISSVNTSYLTF